MQTNLAFEFFEGFVCPQEGGRHVRILNFPPLNPCMSLTLSFSVHWGWTETEIDRKVPNGKRQVPWAGYCNKEGTKLLC
jgi:hypothetical protein